MKKTLLLLAVSVLLVQALPAQWIVNRFETSVKDSMWTITKNSAAKKWYLRMSDTTAFYEGSKALRTVWKVDDADSYGGNDGFEFKRPRAKDSSFFAKNNRWLYKDSTYFNFSGAKYISLWFNNVKKSSVGGGAVQMRLKLHEAGGNSTYWGGGVSDVEDWYAQSANVFDTTAGWKQLIFPLKDNGTGAPNDQGFTFPGWSGTANNSTLDLDKIIGYTVEWTCNKLGGAGADSGTANGEILWDKLQLLGDNYTPIYTFNNFTADTANFKKTVGFYGTQGGITFAEEKVDTLISPSALSVAYKVNISETWGGYANFLYNYPAGTFMQDLSANNFLLMYVKVLDPLKSSSGAIQNVLSMRITLREGAVGDAAGTGDEWYTRARVILDSTAVGLGWQMVQMPLKALPGDWGAFATAPYAGFYAVTGSSDGVMNLNKIKQFKIEFSASKDAGQPNAADLVHSGRILISDMVPVGTRSTDTTAPALVTGVTPTPGSLANLITWTDVPGEPVSKYDVYFSETSFTKITDKGVENLPPFGLPLGTQLANHPLRAPLTDQNISYYYGVTATDASGNQNKPAVVGPITNKAQGVPIIALAPPTNVNIDGIMSDWSASTITPFVINSFRKPAQGHLAPNGACKDSLDLSVKAYLAIDSKNLYVAFDVTDDTVSVDTTANSWEQDSPDMFIGLYDWRGPKHGGYARGATPDYHLRFSLNKIVIDNLGATLMYPSAGNYVWRKKTSGGYVVEAKIPFAQFKAASPSDTLFVPKEGMRIPLDFEINDRDGLVTRDCMLDYSYLNDDNSYQDSWRWVHTWVGAKWVTGVSGNSAGVVGTYELSQNYPNPFNPTTTINYQIPKAGNVTMKMFDVLGREVMTLVEGPTEVGRHSVEVNASRFASGMYFYRLEAGSFTEVKKMMLLK